MVFKINVSHKGKTIKFETENEDLVDKLIGENINGNLISEELQGYELEITGTSDKAGFPGLKEIPGPALKGVLLKRGKGMKNTTRGLILRKKVRGNSISPDTIQINTSVIKEGNKKFSEFSNKTEEKK